MKYFLSAEVFLIPYQEGFLLYVPLKRLILSVNNDAVELLALIQEGREPNEENQSTHCVLNTLQQLGILNYRTEKEPQLKQNSLSPNRVTLFPTYDCNLRCVYCYALGGEEPLSMSFELAQAAIKFVCSNAVKNGQQSFQVNFHGGGEPTMNWQVLVQSVDYAQHLAQQHGLQMSSSMASNCMLTESQVQWIIRKMKYLTASIDGPPEIQNIQRPAANGANSFDQVFATLKKFESLGFPYGIRATVTQATVTRLVDVVTFFCENLKPRLIHLEPLFVCGRCLTTNITSPDNEIFLREFLRAQEQARKFKIRLKYSGSRLNMLSNAFCGATGRNFIVLPDGYVTSCHEVCRYSDPRANSFFYGRYCSETRSFEFSLNKLQKLSGRIVQNIPSCTKCFLKWHCAGDCMAKASLENNDYIKPVNKRCWLNREIAKQDLIKLAARNGVQLLNSIQKQQKY